MPELPEVETVRRQLAKQIEGATIERVCLWQSDRELPKGEAFVTGLTNKTVTTVERRGKLLCIHFTDQSALAIHLKMTGALIFYPDEPTRENRHERLYFVLNKQGKKLFLVWKDIRRFGYVKRLSSADEVERVLAEYGLEPLTTSTQDLAERLLKRTQRSVKAVLLDQSVIAGVGNIYADEACFLARIHPARALRSLSEVERLALAGAIQEVLAKSLEQGGTSSHNYRDTEGKKGGFLSLLNVYGRKDEPCFICQTPITKTVLAGRGTHACLTCQSYKKKT